ncbi:hypothetical protein [Bradyrhizobium guangzhouense]|uniref:hypothetical protein n=1 Tax=Bradyrhizobium guangzhouense TaxID=1325095 RepID=UPI001009FCCA|nr:hypothetical protein [Bradyrhizobium guangzhouense]RXH18341.1 hypothetical protein EAS54_13535 [Bradyrhizobium guangzhouense]
MSKTLFRCPNTGMNVQHHVGEASSETKDGAVVVVSCPACARIHLMNVATGRLVSDPRSQS